MAWPTPQDYNEAIQNPRLAFADLELQTGRPELTPLGLPRAITGGFASVYKLQCPQRTWAVRCFLRQFHDQERRYAAIGEHLTRHRLPYTVGFTFLRDGIRVRSQWYPILKMEWVQGEPLSAFIQKHLGNRDTLLALARRWVEMVNALQQASIAHGDLQHGNVLVVGGQLRLIDYDGMYVPALSRECSHEVGHRNYQHPRRTQSDFGPYLDNFSAWVVYVALIAIAADPKLWKQFGGGDESLLFRRKDFEEPEASDVLRTLQSHPDSNIRSAIALLKLLLDFDPRDVPPLRGQTPPLTVPTDTGRSDSGSWIDDYVSHTAKARPVDRPSAPSDNDSSVPTASGSSWIFDLLEGSSPRAVSFKNPVATERLVLAFSAIFIAVLLGAIPGLASWLVASPLLVLFNLALWIHRFRSDSTVREANDLKKGLMEVNDRILAIDRDIRTLSQERTKLQKAKAAEDARLKIEQQALEAAEKQELNARQAALQSELLSINARRQMFNQQQADELRRIQNDIGARMAALNGRIAELSQAETTAHRQALAAKQRQHIAAYLRGFSLDRAAIPGIGPALKKRLIDAGFRTAADIDLHRAQRVHGIGSTRAQALDDWQRCLLVNAWATTPSTLSDNEAAAIRAEYEGRRRTLKQQTDMAVQRLRTEEENIRAQHRRLLERLQLEDEAANVTTRRAIEEIRARYSQEYYRIRESASKLSHDTESKLLEVDKKIVEARKQLFGLQWRKESLKRQLSAYAGIRFLKYVKRVLFEW